MERNYRMKILWSALLHRVMITNVLPHFFMNHIVCAFSGWHVCQGYCRLNHISEDVVARFLEARYHSFLLVKSVKTVPGIWSAS